METRSKLNSCAGVLLVLSIIISYSICSSLKDANLGKLAAANNEFAINLHRSLASSSSKNLFFSPLSIFFALGMLHKGARGKTAQEMRHFLGYEELGLTDQDADSSFRRLLNQILVSTNNYTLKCANAILVDKRLELVPEYKTEMQNSFHARIIDVDFLEDRTKAVEWINSWVNSKTNGKIPRFVDDLRPDTVMALLNAVYFEGPWNKPFDVQKTKPDLFYNYGSEAQAKMVPTMHLSSRILYASSPGWQLVELSYVGDSISMVILLPDKRDGLAALENDSILRQLLDVRNEMRFTTVHLSLPKFKVKSNIDLKQTLESLGLQSIFKGADFSGMVKSLDVLVSTAMHKAVVEVTEKGSKAAGASGIFIVPMRASQPRFFKVDHPFIFTIMDTKTDIILFAGRVNAL